MIRFFRAIGRQASAAPMVALAALLTSSVSGQTNGTAAKTAATRTAPDERALTPLRDVTGREMASTAPTDSEPLPAETVEVLRTCESYIEDGQAIKAISRLRSFLEQSAQPVYEIETALARAYLETGQMREARELVERASAANPTRAAGHYLLGLIEEASGADQAALRAFRSATVCAEREAENPMVTASWFRLARMLESRGLLLAAVEAYERFDAAAFGSYTEHQYASEVSSAVDAHPNGTAALRATLLRRLGRTEQALATLERALEMRPNDARILALFVETLIEVGRAEQAYEACAQRADDDRLPPSVTLQAALAAGRVDEWLSSLTDQLATEDGHARAIRAARLLTDAGEAQALAKLWAAIIENRPAEARLRWLASASLKSHGEWGRAIDGLAEASRSPEGDRDPGGEAWQEWLRPVRGNEALLRALEAARRRESRDAALDLSCALLAGGAGKLDVAEALLSSCLQARADFVPALVARALLNTGAYQWEKARDAAERAIALNGDYAAAHFALGRALDGLDQHDACVSAYRAALQLRPGDGVYAIGLARRLRGAGDSLGAARYLTEALEQGADSDDALEELIETYIASGKVEVARARLDRARESGIGAAAARRLETLLRFTGSDTQPYADELERQFAAHPNDVKTARRLAIVRLELREVSAAERVLEFIRGQGADDEETWQLSARAAAADLRFNEAAAILDKLSARYPNRRALAEARVLFLLCDFRVEAARALLAELLRTGTAENDSLGLLFHYFACFGRPDETIELLEAWNGPDDSAKAALKALILSLNERHEEAFKLAADELDRFDDEGRWRLYVQIGVAAKRTVEVERRLREAIEKGGNNPGLTGLLIDTLIAAGRADEAMDVARDFSALGMEGETMRRLWMVSCHFGARNYELAVKEIEAMLENRQIRARMGSRRESLRAQLVEALGFDGRHDEALARLNRWYGPEANVDPMERPFGRALRMQVLQTAGRTEEYLRELEAVFNESPNNSGYLNDLGYSWVDLGRNVQRSTQMIRSAVADHPLNSAYLDSLGWAYYKAGDFSVAQKWLARAVGLPLQLRQNRLVDGRDAVLQDHLGDALYRLGDSSGAIQNWKKAVELANATTDENRRRHWAPVAAAAGAKIAAVERGEKPATAPTAAEQGGK